MTVDLALVERAQRFADDVLFPAALATDSCDLVPTELLDSLAAAGLYGVASPVEVGGSSANMETLGLVSEALAGGCLTTAFVWLQHFGAARAAAVAGNPTYAQWARRLASGEAKAGVAFAHLRRPGPPLVVAGADRDGAWRVTGTAPWVTGWGRVDVVHVAARHGDDIVWGLLDAVPTSAVRVMPLRLAAVNASGTVELVLDEVLLPANRITGRQSFAEWSERDAAGLRLNGSIALGVALRCARLLESEAIVARADHVRGLLDEADPSGLPAARAAATRLAVDAAAELMAAGGGRSIVMTDHAQRLAREALFVLVQGQTPAIRAAQRATFE